MNAYKFLPEDGRGVFSRFAWPLPDHGPGAWVESELATCRSGIHACRPVDLPYWIAPLLYEIELDGPVEEQALKIVAARGRLIRRVNGWDDVTRAGFSQMCIARANELARAAPDDIAAWAPAPDMAADGPGADGIHGGANRREARRRRRLRRRAITPERVARRAPEPRVTAQPRHRDGRGL
jgi:hypothetical protein